MFQVTKTDGSLFVRTAVLGLLIANLLATLVTVWIILEVRKEQVVFNEVMIELRRHADPLVPSTSELSYELRWQYGLAIAVLLNIIATGLALAALARAYLISQRSLRTVKELAANILASMDHGVITVDRQGRVNGINPKGCELLDVKESDVGRPLAQLARGIPPLIELNQAVQQTRRAVRDRAFPYQVHGHPVQLMSHGHLLTDDSGTVIGTVLHVTDVTQQALMQERMRRMERFLGLGSVAAGLAHEIKNPLSALGLHAQLLKEQLTGTPLQDAEQTTDILLAEVQRMARVLDGFREFAALDRLARDEIHLERLLQKVARLLQPQLQSQQMTLQLRFDTRLPVRILGDAVKIEQVVINLVLNAMEATDAGGGVVLRAWCENDLARIDVQDTGRGVPESIRDSLFDPYVTTKDHGTGLGLAICEKIVRQHGGSITFTTSEQGTTFHVSLPRGTAAEDLSDELDAGGRLLA